MNNKDEQNRVGIWTVREQSRRLYFLQFTVLFIMGVLVAVVYEVWFVTTDSPMQTSMAVLERIAPMSIIALSSSYIFTEVTMVLADWIQERRQARIERERIKAHAEGVTHGRKDIIDRMRSAGVSEDVIRSIEEDAGLNGKQ